MNHILSDSMQAIQDKIYENIEQLIFHFARSTAGENNAQNIFLGSIENILTNSFLVNIEKMFYGFNIEKGIYMLDSDEKIILNNYKKCLLADEFLGNHELVKINQNLISSGCEDKYRQEKLYEMYSEFYAKDFSIKMNQDYFSDVVIFASNKKIFSANKDKFEFTQNIDIDLIANYIELAAHIIKQLNNHTLRDHHKNRNFANSISLTLYIAFVKKIATSYDIKKLYALIWLSPIIVKELDRIHQKYEKDQERLRLLNGEVSFESNLAELRQSYNKVKTGHDFEKFLAMLFSKIGYKSEVTKGSGDKGADIRLTHGGKTYIIQAKFYTGNRVGFDALKEAYTAKEIYDAEKTAVITNSHFTKQAIENATKVNVYLIDGDELDKIIVSVAKGRFVDVFTNKIKWDNSVPSNRTPSYDSKMHPMFHDWQEFCKSFAQPIRSILSRTCVTLQDNIICIESNSEAAMNMIKRYCETINEEISRHYRFNPSAKLIFIVKRR